MNINIEHLNQVQENTENFHKTQTKDLPPKPPIILTEQVACCENTDKEILWHIARNIPHLRKWVIANPAADAKILEYISQKGGPDVKHSLNVLLESYDYAKQIS